LVFFINFFLGDGCKGGGQGGVLSCKF